jgi:hypothetical protein
VKVLRFRIGWLMAIVALFAIDLAVMRLCVFCNTPVPQIIQLLTYGALPMANVLAGGLMISKWRLGKHPFLLGFEVFGAAAVALYCAAAILFDQELVRYARLGVDLYRQIVGREFDEVNIMGFTNLNFLFVLSIAMLMLGLPQVALALIGGFLFHKFKITVSPR